MYVASHIGQYKILRTLGAGGMGTVFLGEHILLGRRAAIKTLLPTLSSHREIVDRFFTEARAISAISDPGVVQIFDFGYHVDGTAYIVMELLEGESLQARLDRLGRLPVSDALRIARQIAGSLGAAHALGIVHRDLKPGNVFLIRDPEAQSGERTKILDFGVCKLDDDADGTVTQTGTMLGTPVYMSPEQCKGSGKVDHRTDIYSVGSALFHMLAGRPPFACDSVGELIAAHIKEPPPAPSQLVPGVPPEVDTLVLRCLAKDPANRFQTMADLQTAIEQVLAMISDHGAPATSSPATTTPLAEGFRSAYDVNRGTASPTMDALQAAPWFVDSQVGVPPSSISDEWEATPPPRGLGRIFALAAALFFGVIGGLVATSYVTEQRTPAEPPPDPAAAAPLDQPGPRDVALAREVTPPEPVADNTPDDLTIPHDVPTMVERKKVARPPRPHVMKRPAPRRHVPPETTDGSDENEDLYDTR